MTSSHIFLPAFACRLSTTRRRVEPYILRTFKSPPSLEAEKVETRGVCLAAFNGTDKEKQTMKRHYGCGYRKIATAIALTALVSVSPAPLAYAQNGNTTAEPSRASSGGGSGAGGGQGGGGNSSVHDPGPRAGSGGAGQPIQRLNAEQLEYFQNGLTRFMQTDSVSGTIPGETGLGLGPGYNATSCQSCHAQPSAGGSSPSTNAYPNIGPNPQVAEANADGALNALPSFITADGPVREVRFPFVVGSNKAGTTTADGGVHDLFTIAGRTDASGCTMAQPNFTQAAQLDNMIFRIPTPTFGAGLIEAIPDATIIANMNLNAALKRALGISGHTNNSGNDGSVTRFGWKAQNKSLEIFAGEAYNVEMGVTNELFQNERASPDEALAGGLPAGCKMNPTPEDKTNFTASGAQVPSDVVAFAMFMRLLAPPKPSSTNPGGSDSISRGQNNFVNSGCALCHTPSMATGPSSLTAGLSNVNANLYS